MKETTISSSSGGSSKHLLLRISSSSIVKSIVSFVELGSVFLLLGIVIGYHGSIKNNNIKGSALNDWSLTSSSAARFLLSDNNGEIDDDITRDHTCKEYLRNFLNETTDASDECQGMYNAYQGADCVDDSHLHVLTTGGDAANNNDDDNNVQIDDIYENWECCSSIYEYYSTHCQETGLDSNRLLAIVVVLVACGFAKTLIRRHQVQWIPDAAACILVGAIAGILGRLISPNYVKNKMVTFNNDLFLHILLPPIIFEAALTIDKRSFRKHVFPILSFASLGTLLSIFVIGTFTYYASALFTGQNDRIQLPFLDSLLFGSLISSIDPVATLGILSSVGLNQRDTLYCLVFGESLLNDGIAIVLFDTLVKHLGDVKPNSTDTTNHHNSTSLTGEHVKIQYLEQATINEIIGNFFLIAGGSVAIGVACGGICTFYFYYLRGKHNPVTEVSIFFTWALIPFYLSDMFGLSGIIAVMAMGFVLDYFVIGGFQNEEREWIDYIALRCNQDSSHNNNTVMNPQQQQQLQPQPQPQLNNGSNHQFFNLFSNGNDNRYTIAADSRWLNWEKIYTSCYVAFSGRGHLLNKSRHHVNFVAEVISTIMETAIFAYLGLFLFNDINMWNVRLNTISIVGCILSRAIMVLTMSALINVFVYFNVEKRLCQKLYKCCRRAFHGITGGSSSSNNSSSRRRLNLNDAMGVDAQPSYARLLNEYDGNNNNIINNGDENETNNGGLLGDDDDDDLDDEDMNLSTNSNGRQYLDRKTQLILLLAGVRGAVSFALVCNTPVYDAVTKQGSHYKAQLKAMTSSSIFFTIFVFGALTYFVVHQETNDIRNSNNNSNGGSANNNTHQSPFIHHRRMFSSASRQLASPGNSVNSGFGSDEDEPDTPHSSFLEIEQPPANNTTNPFTTPQQQPPNHPRTGTI